MKKALYFVHPAIFVLVLQCFFNVSALSAQETTRPPKVKKIIIETSNNLKIDDRYIFLSLPTSLTLPDVNSLREYVAREVNLNNTEDPEFFLKVMEWVNAQWKHDGLNEPPANATSLDILKAARAGAKYRCLEYGKVVADILHAYGYSSRLLGITSKNIAYGTLGMGHAVTEVWSNKLKKWIFIDPQFSIHARHKDSILNYHEIFNLKEKGKFNEVQFVVSDSYLKINDLDRKKVLEEYRKFIAPYFGYLMYGFLRDGSQVLLVKGMEGREQFITSQGLASKTLVFSENPRDFYFDINRTNILFQYRNDSPALNQIITQYQIKTLEDYTENMGYYAAIPDYSLRFNTSTPWFTHYEIKHEGSNSWLKFTGNEYNWKLHEGVNEIFVRSVNQAGVPGIITYMKIRYE